MASTINAKTTGTGGIEYTGDASGNVAIQSDGTTVLNATANGVEVTGTLYNNSVQVATQNALGVRNLIINGDMRIAQRGTSAIYQYAQGYYTADRWALGTIGSLSSEYDIDVISDAPTGQGFTNALKFSIGYAGGNQNGSALMIQQRFEGQMLQHLKKGTANAESLTLSFWAKSNKTGTYIAELYDNDNARSISKSYTIDAVDTWEKKTITFEGDTSGALDNDNAHSLQLNIFLLAGSDLTSGTLQTSWGSTIAANRAVGQSDFLSSASNYYSLTGVQLEVGDTATPFEHRPYDMELARCQRYYFKDSPVRIKTYSVSGSNNSVSRYNFPTTMRASPTITITTGTTSNLSSASTNQTSTSGTSITLIASSAGTVAIGDASDGAIELNAEL